MKKNFNFILQCNRCKLQMAKGFDAENSGVQRKKLKNSKCGSKSWVWEPSTDKNQCCWWIDLPRKKRERVYSQVNRQFFIHSLWKQQQIATTQWKKAVYTWLLVIIVLIHSRSPSYRFVVDSVLGALFQFNNFHGNHILIVLIHNLQSLP